ncbi:MAG: replicative DNA helicase [Candidatus Borkfalkiaceae bacterium]|nr:replicative DNA helicase [Christensenellaceae bacterium]
MPDKISVMPFNQEAEQSLLGCLLVDQEIQLETLAGLKEEDFYVEAHKLIYDSMKKVAHNNKPIDIVTLSDMMEKDATLEKAGGISYITTIANAMPSSANYRYYLEIVKRDGMLRRIIRSGEDIAKEARKSADSDKALQYAENKIFKISEENETSSLLPLADTYDDLLGELERLERDKNFKQGLKCGFTRIDYLTNGFKPGNLIVLAARPSDGKTTLALNMLENIALRDNAVCAMFALEMTREELAQKLLCSIGSVQMDLVQKGKLSDTDQNGWRRLWAAKKELAKAQIYVDDSPSNTVPTIISKCRRLKASHGLDFVVVDHLQLIYPDVRTSENRQQEVTEISRGLKVLAKELKVPVLALSQLSRSPAQNKRRPMLSDLRESGAIEQDADVVMFIYRPDKQADEKEIASGAVEKNVAEIIIEKNRSGERGSAKMLFKGEFSKFVTYDERMPNIEPPPEFKSRRRERDEYADAPPIESDAEYLKKITEGDIPPDDSDVFRYIDTAIKNDNGN